jgi:hypothetical protein
MNPAPSHTSAMNTFTAILEPAADGTLHLPVPAEWRHGAVKVKAEMEPVNSLAVAPTDLKGFGCLRGRIAMAPDFDEPLEAFRDYMA